GADRVGDVGERRRALVRGDDEVRIVTVMTYAVLRMHDLAVNEVVGDVQQPVDEQAVAGYTLGELRIAVAADRRALDEEAAFGTHRHDDGVLDHLCLDESEHFGAEILAAIRPTQAAARDGPEAQMHAFHTRRADEDLAIRLGLRQIGHARRVELEADVLARLAARRLVVARAQRREDHAEERAQDAVLVDARHAIEQHLERGDDRLLLRVARFAARLDDVLDEPRVRLGDVLGQQRLHLALQALLGAFDDRAARIFAIRVELRLEKLDEQAGDERVAVERLFHVRLRKRHAGLQQVLAHAAQHGDLAPFHERAEDQLVETVVLGLAAPHALEARLERVLDLLDVEVAAHGGLHFEILDHDRRFAEVHLVRVLGKDLETHVLEHRQRLGQRDRRAVAEQLEAQAVALLARAVQRQADVVRVLQAGRGLDVGGGDVRADVLDVARGQRTPVASGELQALLLAVLLHEDVAQLVVPVAHDVRDLVLEVGDVVLRLLAVLGPDHDVQARERGLADEHRRVETLAVERALEQGLDALAHVGVETVARDEHETREEAPVFVAAHEQARARAALQLQDAHRGGEELVLARLEQLVARQRFQDVAQILA